MKSNGLDCAAARMLLQERWDGAVEPASVHALGGHLASCPDCRSLEQDLLEVREALRSAPRLVLPDEDLEKVWDRTVRTEARASRRASGLALFWGAAAAALLIAAVVARGHAPGRADRDLDPDVLQAAADLQFVFRLTDRELRRTGDVALQEVLGGEVAPALRRARPPSETGLDRARRIR